MKKNYLLSRLCLFGLFLSFSFNVQAQDNQEIQKIKKNYNLVKLGKIEEHLLKVAQKEKKLAKILAKEKGWKEKMILPDGRMLELQRVENGYPIYYTTFNVDAAKSTRANHLNTGGSLGLNLMGQSMTAHVWDGGVGRTTHQEYDGAGGTNRLSIGDGSTSRNYHAAHVTGTIMAAGIKSSAKGMAPHAKAVGYDWNNDKAEATSAASNGMLVSNHSYGYAIRNNKGQVQLPQHYFGGYIEESRNWDEIMFNAPNYLMVVAAGNDGGDDSANSNPTGGYGFDKLTGHSTSKNNLVVANAQDANINSNGDLISVAINSSSSEGPTDDYRIKPDITGNGTTLYSSYHNSDNAYGTLTGTSMASPNVTGTLLLLQQHAKNVRGSHIKAATLKGLALHTADDAGANGPDAVFGWGLLNAKKAAETISQNGEESKIEELTLASGQTYTITVESDGISPLLASISWTDRPGTANKIVNSTTPVLVNDLDIRVSKSGTTYLPYELTGALTNAKQDNNVDPYERVDINGASGTYTITVTHKGSLTGGSQNFSLIVTGLTGTPDVCNAAVPSGVSTSGISANSATVSWNAVTGATYDVRYRATGTSNWTTTAISDISTTLNGLNNETQYEVQVRSKCTNGNNSNYSASVKFTTTTIQLNYCTSKGNSVSDEYIQNVKIGSIDNTSNGGNGYADYTAISTSLVKNASNTITITPKWTGTAYNEGYAVWIDYNQDGDFTDNGEQVWTKAASKDNPVSGSFTVPTSASEGATRMRVSLKYNGIPTACEAFNYGEVEDYTIIITGGDADTQAPSVPTNLTATNITQTTATISWTAATDNVGVTSYDVYQGANNIGNVTGTSANISSLTANTQYTFTVKAKDAAGNESATSSVLTFTTLGNQVSYCDSKGSNSSYEWIDNVEFGGMRNATGNDGGYADYTSKIANVAKGSTNQIIISAGFRSTAYTEYWKVWIDYNQNGTFEDSELVASGSSSSANNLSADITIPSSANTGKTRMRISMKYNAAQTACETFSYGEVEDYTVNITNSTSSLYTTFADTDADALGNEKSIFVNAYPNPAINTINLNLGRIQNAPFKIFSITGQLIKSGKASGSEINISNLTSGLYMLETSDGQKSFTTKFVKQ